MENKKRKIDSIQGLRGFAFTLIFGTHLTLFSKIGPLGVSLFIVMSGFLMSLSYYNRIDSMNISLRDNIRFSAQKVKRLYPLHIIMLGVAILFWVIKIVTKTGTFNIKVDAVALIAQLLLVQAWVPIKEIYYSFNALAWYLSVSLLLYMLFPWIIRFIKKKSNKVLIFISVGIYAAMCIWMFFVCKYFFNDSNYYDYFTHVDPLLRLGDFSIGAIFGVIYVRSEKKISKLSASIFEILTVLATIALLYFLHSDHDTLLSKTFSRPTIAFLPISVAVIYLFAVNKGVISKLFSNKAIVYVGNMSPYGYLIHQMVIVLITTFGTYVFHTVFNKWVLTLISVAITWIAIYLYLFAEKHFNIANIKKAFSDYKERSKKANSRKIKSVQGLRAIACMAIFAAHLTYISWGGGWGVSLFIIMSGFLMSLSYYDKIDSMSISLKENVKFSAKKMKRLYPLHIIMLGVAVAFWLLRIFVQHEAVNYTKDIVALVSQAFLVHAWIPVDGIYCSFNVLSWYLSVSLFLYIVFPWIMRKLKAMSARSLFVLAFAIYLLMWLWETVSMIVFADNKGIQDWFTYINPILRTGDFSIGAIFGIIFIRSKKEISRAKASVFEIITVLMIALTVFLKLNYNVNLFTDIAVRSPICFLPTSLALIYLLALNKGIISRFISNKVLVFIGDKSPYIYLIHQMAIYIISTVFAILFNFEVNKWLLGILSVILTAIGVFIYQIIENYLFNREKTKKVKQ